MDINYHTDNPSKVILILTVYQTHGTHDQKWIFTILCKFIKIKTMVNTIMRIKYKGCDTYNTLTDYFNKYGAEVGAVTQ